jgi:hypothetical protein
MSAAGCGGSDGTDGSQDAMTVPGSIVTTPPPTTGGVAGNAAASQPPTTSGNTGVQQPPVQQQQPVAATGWCDAIGVIKDHCQECHGAARKFGAPMSMVTYDDLQKPAVTMPTKKVYELVSVRVHSTSSPMPPMNYPRLDNTALATLEGWIAAGALPGADPTCGGAASVGDPTDNGANVTTGTSDTGEEWPADCQDHYKFLAYTGSAGGAKYTVPAGSEQHPSFYFTPPWTGQVQALAFHPVMDNAKVLHHWILYDSNQQFINGWAPGAEKSKHELPADVGIYLPPGGTGQQLRLDVHYNNLGGTTDEQDSSGVEVCVISDASKFRANTATVYGLRGDATAPAHQMVDNATTCSVMASSPVHVLTNSPHMHRLGVHAKLELLQGGMDKMLHDAAFSFDDQESYPMDNVVVNSGDQFTVTCSYNNTTDANVSFGQNTEDEMCFNFVLYYPKDALNCF